MATTYTFSGTLAVQAAAKDTFGTDATGNYNLAHNISITFTASTAPIITGFFFGTATCAAGDWLLAHATDPLQGMGDATYSPGFTVAGSKLKLLIIENTDTTNTITFSRGTTNGLPIFGAADDAITLAAYDVFLLYKKAGTAALTTGSNDKVTIAVGAGSPTARVSAFYGS